MAIVTETIATVSLADGEVRLAATYDDVTGDLTSFTVTNTTARTLTGQAEIIRASGVAWRSLTGTLPPGDSVFNAGGPVRNWTDLSRYSIGVVA